MVNDFKVIFNTSRCMTFEIADGGIYNTKETYELVLNDELHHKTNKVIDTVYDLAPDTLYNVVVRKEKTGEKCGELVCRTKKETVTLNVLDFGAKGDGIKDDTLALQAAIMGCPKGGRVLFPKGTYRFVCLFLKSDMDIELAEGAELTATTKREEFPFFPGMVPTSNELEDYNLGTWEGEPGTMFCGLITAVQVKNVNLYGKGIINGNASFENWWKYTREQKIAWRPRMVFLNQCENITMEGITVLNSPSWNIHPYFSKNMRFLRLDILSPKNSCNTDGLNPESCEEVEITGVHFSVGDDCIAIKSGKIYMGRKYKTPCKKIRIRQCSMNDGHGSVVLGSEMGAGIYDLSVKDCKFTDTDRGLRIKTRRGRGEDAVISDVEFSNIEMDGVLTPFTVNCFYFCDVDGKSEYVQNKKPLPVDENTPEIKSLVFRNIHAKNVHYAAAFLYGLPEKKIGEVIFEHINISYAKDSGSAKPEMMCDIPPMSRIGIYGVNIENLTLRDVNIAGQAGEKIVTKGVENLTNI
jgi:polygalacturonase